MNGQDWINQLPEMPSAKRRQMTMDAISSNLAAHDWVSVLSDHKGHQATFWVNSDAFYVPLNDGSRFRFPVTASMAQEAADLLDALLPTTKIMDLRHLTSNQQSVTTLPAGPQMSSISYSKNWNQRVEVKRNGNDKIISDIGKPWILDNQLANSQGACLYGFYDKNAPYLGPGGLKVWQTVGTKHNKEHQDYSSTLLLLDKTCIVDGQQVNTIDVMKDPILSYLLNYDGVLKYTRLP